MTFPSSSSPVIEASRLTKRYQHIVAVDAVDLQVQQGEFFGLLGPNGAGKTTLMKMLYHFSGKDGGELRVFGQDPETDPVDVKCRIGVVPQEDNLDPELSVWENLDVYSNYYGIPRKHRQERIERLLEFFDLEHRKHWSIRALSGGIKRRLVILRALLHNPRLLLLDEPTTGLDPAARHLIWDKLKELKRAGITLLLTTHYMDEAATLCDRLVIMHAGRILVQGKPRDLVREHFERYVLETERNVPAPAGVRKETHGPRTYYHSNEEAPLRALQNEDPQGSGVLRHPTLEDLFLKLTGRTLHE